MNTHLFLVGAPGSGKSTLICQALAEWPGLRLGGFRTVTRYGAPEGAVGTVHLLPAERSDMPCTEENRVGVRWNDRRPEGFPAVFDALGPELLRDADCDLRLMDELGRMETEAPLFVKAVLRCLQEPTPVLGVIQRWQTPLLDAVRAHPGVRLLKIDPCDRESGRAALAEWLSGTLTACGAFR